jgi:GT2 family glycosyltransferase
MDVSKTLICLLSFNQKDLTLDCLASLTRLEGEAFKILLFDNGSDDDLINTVNKKYPTVETIKLGKNLGPAGGRNLQIRHFLNTDYDYLFFIDNDAVVEKNTLTELIKVAQTDDKIGAVCARVFYFDRPDTVWNEGAMINWRRGEFINLNRGRNVRDLPLKPREIDTFPYGFGLIKREALEKVGLVPAEPYFMYYEETEWHLRFRKLGYKIFVAPEAKIYHKVSCSLGMESPKFFYYRTRNRLLFMARNAQKRYIAAFMVYFIYDFTCRTVISLILCNQYKQLQAAIAGMFDFFTGRYGYKTIIN